MTPDFDSIINSAAENASCAFLSLSAMKRSKPKATLSIIQSLKVVIGICGGDGIGPIISKAAGDVLEFLLAEEIKEGKIELRYIEGLTIENRVAHNQAIPDDVMEELYKCPVILKGPTTTPRAGDPWPNIESANVAMRKKLDLFANVRPVKIPKEGIDWTFSVKIPGRICCRLTGI